MIFEHKHHKLLLYFYFIGFFISSSYCSYINQKQDITIQHQVDAKRPSIINIEDLLHQNLPFNTILEPSDSCTVQPASLLLIDSLPFAGSFSNGEKVFFFNNRWYTLKVNPKTHQIYLVTYDQGFDRLNQKSYIQVENRLFAGEFSEENEIMGVDFYAFTAVFRTKSNLLVFNLLNPSNPTYLGLFPVYSQPIKSIGVVRDTTLYVAGEYGLGAYSLLEIEQKQMPNQAVFTNFELPDKRQLRTNEVQTIAVCDDVVFFGVNTFILAFKEHSGIFYRSNLPIQRVFNVESEILQIQKVGRSLVVMTAEELIEYLFVDDCLDLHENMRVLNTLLGLDPKLSLVERKAAIEVRGSSQEKYFAILNRWVNTVYIFESASINAAQDSSKSHYQAYKDPDYIQDFELYDFLTNSTSSNLTMYLKTLRDKVSHADGLTFSRNPVKISCERFLPVTDVVTMKTVARFCHNTMYNYTAFVEKNLEKIQQNNTYTNDFYFDPSKPCKRTVVVELRYGWPSIMIIAIAGIVVGIVFGVGIAIKFCWNKKKKVSIYRGHVRFSNDKQDLSATNHKIDISSLSANACTERTGNDVSIADKKNDNVKTGLKKQKSFSKRKSNLTIKIPEN